MLLTEWKRSETNEGRKQMKAVNSKSRRSLACLLLWYIFDIIEYGGT